MSPRETLEPASLQVVWLIPGLTPPAPKRDPSPRRCWLAPWPCRVDPCPWNGLLLRELPEVESDAGEGRRRLGMVLEPSCAPCPVALALELCSLWVSAPGTPQNSWPGLEGLSGVPGLWGLWSSCPGCVAWGMRWMKPAIYSSEGVSCPPAQSFSNWGDRKSVV